MWLDRPRDLKRTELLRCNVMTAAPERAGLEGRDVSPCAAADALIIGAARPAKGRGSANVGQFCSAVHTLVFDRDASL
jgi:hypothetical protein